MHENSESFTKFSSSENENNKSFQSSSETKRKRNYFTIERKLELMKHVKRYVGLGLTYDEMKRELEKQGFKVSLGLLFKLSLAAKEDIVSTREITRVILERIEKKRLVERQALQILSELNKTKKDENGNEISIYNAKDKMYILKSFMEIQRQVDDFLSRFNVLSAIPVRQEVEIKPKVDIQEIINKVFNEVIKDDTKMENNLER